MIEPPELAEVSDHELYGWGRAKTALVATAATAVTAVTVAAVAHERKSVCRVHAVRACVCTKCAPLQTALLSSCSHL